MQTRVADWVSVLDGLYDPSWAEEWDAVGLVTGDPDAPVSRGLFAIDPTPGVLDEAQACGATLIVAHHPLLLRGVHGIAESTPKGRLLARLVRSGVALFTAHTNADVASPGVSDALARALGLGETVPLHPVDPDAGLIAGGRGLGRVGSLDQPLTAGELTRQVASALPTTPAGVRLAGDADRTVSRVAVCGGAGDDFIDDAIAAQADIYVTADLRHHVAAEAVERGLLLIDAGHWASEWPWLADASARVTSGLGERGHTVSTVISTLVTDPWTSVICP